MPLMESITLEGSANFRDLGGYQTADGRTVRTGVVFRSGHLANLTDADVVRLDALGLKTVVDFRADHELEVFGHDRLNGSVDRVSIPIGNHKDHQDFYESIQAGDFTALHDLAQASRTMVRDNADDFAALLRLIAESDNLPLVFHCIGGKDRTGVAAALILSLLGVPWETVRTDYLRSNEALRGTLEEQISRLSDGKVPVGQTNDENLAALRKFFILEGSYIDAARDEIANIAGSFENYVAEWLQLSQDHIAAIRTNLLRP